MAPEQHPGQCESCGAAFQWYPIHNGFNNSFYVYCPDCGTTAILDFWGTPLTGHPAIAGVPTGGMPKEVEDLLDPCPCGSRFRAGSRPRCPHCGHELLPRARAIGEAANQPQRTVRGWPLTWNPAQIYCVVINGKVVYNPFGHLDSQ